MVDLISDIASQTNLLALNATIEGISRKIGAMDEISTVIASAIEEQGAATGEISNNSQQASVGTQEVSQNIAGVNQAAMETGSAAAQVLNSAADLAKQSNALRSEV